VTWLYWLIGAALFGVAAFAIWRTLQRPAVLAAIAAMAVRTAANAIVTKAKARMTPEEEAEMRREQRAGRGDEWLRKWHRRKR
jgi:hypothetical protein